MIFFCYKQEPQKTWATEGNKKSDLQFFSFILLLWFFFPSHHSHLVSSHKAVQQPLVEPKQRWSILPANLHYQPVGGFPS